MKRQAGFTLIEVAVVIAIIGLLLGGLLVPMATQVSLKRMEHTRGLLEEVKDALYGFAMIQGRLPCPDADGDGGEDRAGAFNDCVAVEGNLPWVELGVGQQDAWGRPVRYRVTGAFANDNPLDAGCLIPIGTSFGLCTLGDITVRDGAGGSQVASEVPAIAFSFGPRADQPDCPPALPRNLSPHEEENANCDGNFVARQFGNEPANEFDDLTAWVSPNILRTKMVTASLLP